MVSESPGVLGQSSAAGSASARNSALKAEADSLNTN